jgi:hypothetical protein
MSMVCERGWGGQAADSDWSVRSPHPFWNGIRTTDILQYRLRFGFSLLYKSKFHLNRLTAQLSYEGRAAVEGGK